MKKTSRYADVTIFAADPRGNSDFKGVRPRDIPRVEALAEHTVKAGERMDQLAQFYYQADRLWYRMGDANADFMLSADMLRDLGGREYEPVDPLGRADMVGRIILIPAAKD